MKKDFYNTFIAMLKQTGLSETFSCAIADVICNDDLMEDITEDYKNGIYQERLLKVKKAIQKTFITA